MHRSYFLYLPSGLFAAIFYRMQAQYFALVIFNLKPSILILKQLRYPLLVSLGPGNKFQGDSVMRPTRTMLSG